MSVPRLTPHFAVQEFDCRDGTPVQRQHIGGLRHLCEWWLEPMREEFGVVTVYSGFRTVRYNASVGGVENSVHLLRTPLPGRAPRSTTLAAAGDVGCARGGPEEWGRWARAHRARSAHLGRAGRGGVGVYAGQDFVHLDTWTRRDWTG